jgi:hypothetical protein
MKQAVIVLFAEMGRRGDLSQPTQPPLFLDSAGFG